MSSSSLQLKVALVHDRLNVQGGGEQVLYELAALYPQAPIFTLIYDPIKFQNTALAGREIHTSFIDRLPGAAAQHRYYIPLMPTAIETFDLSPYDLILSSSAAFAHGVRTHPGQVHLSYIHSPMRYAWHQYREHISRFGLASPFVSALLAYLRSWDRRASSRATAFAANSAWTAKAVETAFGRPATVIHPPVHVESFTPAAKRDDYYLTVSRLVPYKRIDLIVDVFSQLGQRLLVVGAGPEEARIKKLAKSNVEFLSYQPPSEVARLMSRAKAFVFAAEEDFGIAAVEAQAAGCPVIAFARGGLTETVINGKTGVFFHEQSVASLVEAIARFEHIQHSFDPNIIHAHSQSFNAETFRINFAAFVKSNL